MAILKDKYGKPQGITQTVAGSIERLLDLGGKVIATYRPDTDWTYDNHGERIGTGNRLAGTKTAVVWSVSISSFPKRRLIVP